MFCIFKDFGSRLNLLKVENLLVKEYKLSIGPAIQDYDLGPLISKKQVERVKKYLSLGEDLKQLVTLSLENNEFEQGNFVFHHFLAMFNRTMF